MRDARHATRRALPPSSRTRESLPFRHALAFALCTILAEVQLGQKVRLAKALSPKSLPPRRKSAASIEHVNGLSSGQGWCAFSRLRKSRGRTDTTAISAINKEINEQQTEPTKENIRIGFIGCGTIAVAIATGLLTASSSLPFMTIYVSRRSISKSKALQKAFPDSVVVCDDNQEIIRHCDLVFLTVLPQQCSPTLQALDFDPDRHLLISLVSTSTLPQLARDSKLGLSENCVFKMICLPAVAYQQGLCLITPRLRTPVAQHTKQDLANLLPQLLGALGGYLGVETEQALAAMMVPSCLMGGFYGILQNNRDWLVSSQGISAQEATYVVAKTYQAMIHDATRRLEASFSPGQGGTDSPGASGASILFDELLAEQTPGGLNEQGWENLRSLGIAEAYDAVQESILLRITGKSDGSLGSS
jgi:pyrroline-5-carboxylate reductase